MIFRKLSKEEHILTRALYEECFFEDAPEFVDYYYRYHASENEIWAAIEEKSGKVISMLHANPVEVVIRGISDASVTIPYLVAIGTAKKYRRQGLMRQLMQMALAQFAEQKIPFTFLMPASEQYYTPFGFERAWSWKWEEDVCGWKQQLQGESCRKPAQECSDAQLEELSEQVNSILAENFDMYAKRSIAYYRRLQEQQEASEGSLQVLFSKEGKPLCAVCTAKEAFPPMMIRMTDQAQFSAMTGQTIDTKLSAREQFANVMICEVV